MSRINYAAKHEYESMANYKILQTVFQRNRIDKPIPVDRLVRCKMQDNLEFLQWLKKFWDTNYAGDGYDADARRAAAPSRAGSAASPALRFTDRSGFSGRAPSSCAAATFRPGRRSSCRPGTCTATNGYGTIPTASTPRAGIPRTAAPARAQLIFPSAPASASAPARASP